MNEGEEEREVAGILPCGQIKCMAKSHGGLHHFYNNAQAIAVGDGAGCDYTCPSITIVLDSLYPICRRKSAQLWDLSTPAAALCNSYCLMR